MRRKKAQRRLIGRFNLGSAGEKRTSAAGAGEDAGALLVVQRRRKGPLGASLYQDVVGLGRQLFLPLLLRTANFKVRSERRLPIGQQEEKNGPAQTQKPLDASETKVQRRSGVRGLRKACSKRHPSGFSAAGKQRRHGCCTYTLKVTNA